MRIVVLGYLWRLARAVHQCPHAELVGVGLEPQRAASSQAEAFCQAQGIRTFDARGLAATGSLRALCGNSVDLLIVAAFGQILPAPVLREATAGALNFHASPLPAYRGGHPIQEQILAGESQIGATLHWLTPGIDEGPIAAQELFAISPDDHYPEILERAHACGERLLADLLQQPVARWPQQPQVGGEPARRPRRAEELALDWRQGAEALVRQVRAYGFLGWTCFMRQGGQSLEVRRAALAHSDSRPGALHRQGDHWLIGTAAGAIKLIEWVSDSPLVEGEVLR